VEDVIDTHVHLVSDDAVRFPRQVNASATHPWWASDGLDRAALVRQMATHGVGAALVVQAVGVYGYDNSYLHEATAHGATALGATKLAGVAALDMDRAGVGDEIVRLAQTDGVAGIRLFAVSPGSSWIERGKADEAFAAAAQADIPLVLTVFEYQLPALMPAIGRYPTVRLALDHCAFPTLDGGRIEGGSPLLELSGARNLTLKVSSHTLLDVAAPHSPSELVDDLLSRFGPDRLMWGSDWPQTPLPTYAAHLELAHRACGHLAPATRVKVFRSNAVAWLGGRSVTIVGGTAVAGAAAGQGEHDDADR
jgi:predicted TIM-barrel fold metal-dependent hydrolase